MGPQWSHQPRYTLSGRLSLQHFSCSDRSAVCKVVARELDFMPFSNQTECCLSHRSVAAAAANPPTSPAADSPDLSVHSQQLQIFCPCDNSERRPAPHSLWLLRQADLAGTILFTPPVWIRSLSPPQNPPPPIAHARASPGVRASVGGINPQREEEHKSIRLFPLFPLLPTGKRENCRGRVNKRVRHPLWTDCFLWICTLEC